jgi:uncharacterized protein with PQ loop repeat
MSENYFIVGLFALALWSFQLAPQVAENWRRQTTKGLSPFLMLSWTLGSLATAIYNIGANIGEKYSILFIIQPNLFMFFSIISWAQCTYYDIDKIRGVLLGIGLTLLVAGFELLGGLLLLHGASGEWPFILLGSMSLTFFAIGYIPQYMEIFTTMKVEGISLVFLSIDILGSVFSIASLAMQQNFEPISGACYIVVFVLDGLIIVLYYVLPWRQYICYQSSPLPSSSKSPGDDVINSV